MQWWKRDDPNLLALCVSFVSGQLLFVVLLRSAQETRLGHCPVVPCHVPGRRKGM